MSTGESSFEDKSLEAERMGNLAVVTEGPIETGLEELVPGDFIVPVVSIVHEKSTIEGRAPLPEEYGKLYNPVMSCVTDSLTVVPIVYTKTRLRMPEKYEQGNKPFCGSIDFQHPSIVFEDPKNPDYPAIQRGPCSACPASKWGVKKSGAPDPPACWEVWNFLFVSEDLSPFWMRFKVTSLAPARRYVSALTLTMQINKAPMWHFASNLTVVKGSKAWEPNFGRPTLIAPEMRAKKDEIRAALATLRPPHKSDAEVDADFAQMDEQGEGNPLPF